MSNGERHNQTVLPSKADEAQRRWNLYMEHAKQTWQDIQTSTDQFDRSLLTLSSGALGLSLAFITNLVPLKQSVGRCWLLTSWASFALCIAVTVASFHIGVLAQNKQLDYLKQYYINRKEEYFNKRSFWSKALEWCTLLGALAFLGGLVCTLIFVFQNVGRIHS